MSPKILIADTDPIQRGLLETMVNRFGYKAETADTGERVLDRLHAEAPNKGESRIDLLILDLMPALDGMAVLARLRAREDAIPTIVQTTSSSIDAAEAALRAGACDFVVKPVGAERLQVSIKNALRLDSMERELRQVERCAARTLTFTDLVASSPAMERVIGLGERAAKSTIPVVLEGEPGVGKQTIARAIHGGSTRRGRPFLAAHCGVLPEDLFEAVLFGHGKGAFANGAAKHIGKFAEASGGALFLDEVSELPLGLQEKLLRVLQEGEINPVGTKRSQKIDVRLLFGTSRNLIELVKRGRFREDLYYRLNVFPISVPSLRQRREDISDLARRFCARFATEEGKKIRGLSADALALLEAYDWPGNVGQLENAVFRAVVLADSDELTIAEFPQIAAKVGGSGVLIPVAPPALTAQTPCEQDFVRVELRDPNCVALLEESGGMRRLDHLEAEAIRFALGLYRGRMSAAARGLGIGRSTLYRKMKDYGLALEPPAPQPAQRRPCRDQGSQIFHEALVSTQ